jgi:hypothetical protein
MQQHHNIGASAHQPTRTISAISTWADQVRLQPCAKALTESPGLRTSTVTVLVVRQGSGDFSPALAHFSR